MYYIYTHTRALVSRSVYTMATLLSLFFFSVLFTVFLFLLRRSRYRRLRLPPGSLGLPFIGETLQLISAYKSDNPEPFVDKRVNRYGPIFMTHIFGEPTVFSADPETNRFILLNEGKLFDCSYPGSISNLLGKHSLLLMKGALHKRMHSLTMSFANSAIIKDHLLVDIDRLIRLNLDSWSDRVLLMEEAKKVINPLINLLDFVSAFLIFKLKIINFPKKIYKSSNRAGSTRSWIVLVEVDYHHMGWELVVVQSRLKTPLSLFLSLCAFFLFLNFGLINVSM